MKTINFTIPIKAVDGYLYCGTLFLILQDGNLIKLDWSKIIESLISQHPSLKPILTLSFLRNDWYTNSQSSTLMHLPRVLNSFLNSWDIVSNEKMFIEMPVSSDAYQFECKTMPILDIKAYGMRLYIGDRSGLVEAKMEYFKKSNKIILGTAEKVFDSKVIAISAKSGEVLVSAGKEGLFSGSLWYTNNDKIKISEKKIQDISIKTEWANYNLVNYETPSKLIYLENSIEHVQEKRGYLFSDMDESSKKIRIVDFGTSKYELNDLLKNHRLKDHVIKYAFNSNNILFLITADNKFYGSSFMENRLENKFYLNRNLKEFRNVKKGKKPLSSYIVYKGCVIEYFDSADLYLNNTIINISQNPIYTLRTFLGSRRYRNMFLIFNDDGIHIHSIYPYV